MKNNIQETPVQCDMPIYPTVVVGVGQAGVKILSKVQDVVKESGDRDQFRFIALDSDKDTLETAPTEARSLYLDASPMYIAEDREAYPYLTENMRIEGPGAKRQRPVGRYKVDHRGMVVSETSSKASRQKSLLTTRNIRRN